MYIMTVGLVNTPHTILWYFFMILPLIFMLPYIYFMARVKKFGNLNSFLGYVTIALYTGTFLILFFDFGFLGFYVAVLLTFFTVIFLGRKPNKTMPYIKNSSKNMPALNKK